MAPSPRVSHGALARLALVAVALASCWSVCGVVRAALPWPAASGLQAKRAWWAAHKDEVDVLLLGSSRVARGYVPAVIEEELAAAHRPLTVFNFGVIGMASYEADHVLDWVLSTRPARLRWIVLEPESWRPDRPGKVEKLSPRDVHWRTARLTSKSLRAVFLAGAPWDVTLASCLEQLARFGMRATNLGRLRWWLEQSLAPDDDEGTPSLEEVARHRGWQPYAAQHSEQFLRMIAIHERRGAASAYGRMVESVRAMTSPDSVLLTFDVASVDEQVRAVRRAGAEPIHAIGPSVREKPWIRALARGGHIPWLLDYQDPDAFPELYDMAYRYDTDHLNVPGAREFSRRFGRDLAALMARIEGDAAR